MLGSRATMAEEKCEARSGIIPNDVVQDILLRLPVKSVARFRCVSKSWLSITTDPSFLRAQARRAPNSLLIHAKKYNFGDPELGRINLHIWSPSTGDGYGMASRILPARRRSSKDVVFASFDGLICLRDNFREEFEMQENVPWYYVLNPLTGAQIDVPRPSFSEGHLMGLYFYPSTGEYRLIRRLNSISGFDKVELLTLGTESWRQIEVSPPALTVCTPTPVHVNGNLYWIAYDTTEFKACGVLGFDIMAEEFKLMPLPLGNGHRYANSSLIDMGEILGISTIDRESSPVNELGIDIWVVKDYENVGWSKMYSVRCSGGINRVDFRIGYSVDDIALCIREEEIVLLFVGPVSYLVQFDLKFKKYCIEQILDPDNLMWHYSLFYKESLISYDSFCNR